MSSIVAKSLESLDRCISLDPPSVTVWSVLGRSEIVESAAHTIICCLPRRGQFNERDGGAACRKTSITNSSTSNCQQSVRLRGGRYFVGEGKFQRS